LKHPFKGDRGDTSEERTEKILPTNGVYCAYAIATNSLSRCLLLCLKKEPRSTNSPSMHSIFACVWNPTISHCFFCSKKIIKLTEKKKERKKNKEMAEIATKKG
jgi:hypothetical protein